MAAAVELLQGCTLDARAVRAPTSLGPALPCPAPHHTALPTRPAQSPLLLSTLLCLRSR